MKPLPAQRLQGKHAVLTGAAGGIGLAVAAAFLEQGAQCTLADLPEQAPPDVAELLARHPQAQYVATDVTQAAAVAALITQAEQAFGPITTLYNNAGIFDMAPLLDSDEAMYERIFAVNVKGAFFVMQQVLAHMVQHGTHGALINMASQAGRRGHPMVAHYCASKAAVISHTQSAALAMAPHHIRVNAIAPGVIDTPMWDHIDALFAQHQGTAPGERKRQVGAAVPLGYMGRPEDICGAAVFLASDEASYITAQTLNVCGGNVMN